MHDTLTRFALLLAFIVTNLYNDVRNELSIGGGEVAARGAVWRVGGTSGRGPRPGHRPAAFSKKSKGNSSWGAKAGGGSVAAAVTRGR